MYLVKPTVEIDYFEQVSITLNLLRLSISDDENFQFESFVTESQDQLLDEIIGHRNLGNGSQRNHPSR